MTLIDFGPVFRKEKTLEALSAEYRREDLGKALDGYIDFTRQVLDGVTDAQAVYTPIDSEANDPYAATEDERHLGWSLMHLVMHVTASAEEGAAFSSILARGIALGGRLRSERDWRQMTTCAQAIARLEECRRMCRAYLDTWPDEPNLETRRILPEKATWTPPNAPMQFLSGLSHWHRHVEQFQKVAEQARAAVVPDSREAR